MIHVVSLRIQKRMALCAAFPFVETLTSSQPLSAESFFSACASLLLSVALKSGVRRSEDRSQESEVCKVRSQKPGVRIQKFKVRSQKPGVRIQNRPNPPKRADERVSDSNDSQRLSFLSPVPTTAWPPNSRRRAAMTLSEKVSSRLDRNRCRRERPITGAETLVSMAC
jgi:hypothetical protein